MRANFLSAAASTALAIFALSAIASGGAGAQTRADSARADSAGQLGAVVVTAPPPAASSGGAATFSISPRSLNLSAAPVLDEVLRIVPFVLVRRNSRGETELSARGSESRQMAVMLDGLPLTLGWDHRTDASLIPMAGVRRVEIVRGLSSLLYGPNVLGGIIDMSTGGGSFGSAPARELVLGSGVDQYGARTASFLLGEKLSGASGGGLLLRAGGGFRESDGVALAKKVHDANASDDLRTNSHSRQRDAFAAARWEGASGRFVGVTATGYNSERGVAPELHLEEPRFWRYPSQSRTLAVLSAGTNPFRYALGYAKANLSAGYNRGTMHLQSFDDATYATLRSEEHGDERAASIHLRVMHSLPLQSLVTAAFTGGRVHYTEILGSTRSAYEQKLWSSGAEVELPVSARLSLAGGVVNDASTTPEAGGKTPLARRDSWGWRGGASFGFMGDAGRLHASVSRRSRFPALRELYSGSLERFVANPELRPETLLGSELGFTITLRDAKRRTINVQSVLFHHELNDAVVRTVTDDSKFIRINRDRIRSTGVELYAAMTPASSGLSLSGELLVQDVSVRDNSAAAPERFAEHQPEMRAKFEASAPIVARIRGLGSVRHVGKQYCVHPEQGGVVRLSSQTAGDAALNREWKIGGGTGMLGRIRVVLALDNVTDRAVYDQCGLPQPGRTARVGIVLGP